MGEDYLYTDAESVEGRDDFSGQYIKNYERISVEEAAAYVDRILAAAERQQTDPLNTTMADSIQSGMESREDVDILGPARQKTYGGSPEEATRGMASSVMRNVADIPLSAAYGAFEGVREASKSISELREWLEVHNTPVAPNPILAADKLHEIILGDDWKDMANPVQGPDTATGEIASKISQFLTGFATGGQALKGWKTAGAAGQFAKASVQGAISDFAFFDAQEDRLSNLIQEIPALQNPVTEFLAATPDDSQALGRFKNAIEGLGLGAATEAVARGLGAAIKGVRAWRAGRAGEPPLPEDELISLRGAAGETPPTAIEELGDLDRPLIEEISGKEAADLGEEMTQAAPGAGGKSADGNFYINFARIDSPDDVKDAIQIMADRNRESLNLARRGEKVTFKEMELSAEQEDAWKVLADRRTGEPLNAEQSLAARALWASSGQKLADTAKAVQAAPTEENMFAFMKMLNVHNAIQHEVIAARTETARALASWRIPSGPKELQLRQMEGLIGYMKGGSESIRKLAEDVVKLSDAGLVREMDKFIEKAPLAIARESIQEYWVMSLLSGPKTHIVNMMSNTMVALQQIYERGVASRIRNVWPTLDNETNIPIGEGMALLNGEIGGIKDAFRLAGKAFKENQSGFYASKIDLPPTPAISAENWGLAKNTVYGKAVDVVGQVVRLPGRALSSEDEFFKTIGYRSQLHALAYREATREAAAGKIGQNQIRERMADILENPPDNLKIASIDHAAYSTFSDAPGKFAQKWLEMCRDAPGLRFFTPFIRTPARIFNYTVAERSPMAPLFRNFREDIAAGGAREQLALARVSTSTAIMLAAADLAFSGNITGGGPRSPSERQTMMRGGWQPYSAKIGDRYFSYVRTDPLGMTLGVAADLAEIVNHMDHDDREVDAEEATTFFAASIAGNVMSKSYMSGLSDLMEAMANPKMSAEGYASRFAGSFVPTGLAEAAKFNDPYMLEVNNMVDAMKARIPGLSKDLPPRRDLWGRAISYRSGLGAFYDAVSPIASRRENPEPIDEEMLRLETYVATPSRRVSFDGVAVDLGRFEDAYSRYVQLAGNELKHPVWSKGCRDYLNEVIDGQGPMSGVYELYTDGPEGGKADFIRATINEYRRYAREVLLDEYPELGLYLDEKKTEQPGKYQF